MPRKPTKKTAKRKVVKKKTPAKKKVTRKKKELITDEKIQELIVRGRERGFVTESELLNLAPRIEEDISGLEKTYDMLKENNIKVVESIEFLEKPT